MTDPYSRDPSAVEPHARPPAGWWQRFYAGRHVTLTAGALDEPGALPVPSWGSFAGIAQGALTAILCLFAAFPAVQDGRHGFVGLMITAVVAGTLEVVAAIRLRRGTVAPLTVLLLAAVVSLVGDVAVAGKHELHRPPVTAAFVLLAAVTLVGAVPEWLNADRSRRSRPTVLPHEGVEQQGE